MSNYYGWTARKTESGYSLMCGKCGGRGGHEGWPGYTCYNCNGAGNVGTMSNEEYAAHVAELAASAERRKAKAEKLVAAMADVVEKRAELMVRCKAVCAAYAERREKAPYGIWAFVNRTAGHVKCTSVVKARVNAAYAPYFAAIESELAALPENWDAAPVIPETNYLGSVGERITLKVKVVHTHTFETAYGVSTFNIMETECGNPVVWKSSNCGLEKGSVYLLKGTVKEHAEYKGKKQTVLTRCKKLDLPESAEGVSA